MSENSRRRATAVWVDDPVSEGEAVLVPLPDGPPPWRGVIVVRLRGELRAYWNVCRHLPIPLDGGMGRLEWAPDGPPAWRCVTHGARFLADDGRCVEGPCAGEVLFSVPVGEQEGRIWIRPAIPEVGG